MKTMKIISALSLILAISVSSAFAGSIGSKGGNSATSTAITYQVNLVGSFEKPTNVAYLVELFNQNYQRVAPAQPYVTGKNQYIFQERGPVEGIRIAVVVRATSTPGLPDPGGFMVTNPAVLKGLFEPCHVYRFDLYPKPAGKE